MGFVSGATGHSESALYQQKEKAFLDANDLTKYVPSFRYALWPSGYRLDIYLYINDALIGVDIITKPPYHRFQTLRPHVLRIYMKVEVMEA